MANKVYNSSNREVYINGNNAIKIEGNYAKYKSQRSSVEDEENNMSKRMSKKHMGGSNRAYTIALVFAIIVMLGTSMLLVKSQFAVTAASEEVIDLQKELVQLKKSNELLTSDINHSINMNEVYEIATTQLGMIQPTRDHVAYVSTSDHSYTIQFDAINVPYEETEVTLGNVLGFIK